MQYSSNSRVLTQLFKNVPNSFSPEPKWDLFKESYLAHISRLNTGKQIVYQEMPLRISSGVYEPGAGSSTSLLIDALSKYSFGSPIAVLEMCCGSGAVSIYLAKRYTSATITAADLLPQAVADAWHNAHHNKVPSGQIKVIQSDLYQNIDTALKFDLILCNAPFFTVAAEDYCEKNAALSCPQGGFLRRLMQESLDRLNPSGVFLLELSNCTDLQFLEEFENMVSYTVINFEYDNSSEFLKFVVAIEHKKAVATKGLFHHS